MRFLRLAPMALLVGALGCVETVVQTAASPQSDLARGDDVTTGQAKYDDFFATVKNVRSRTSDLGSSGLDVPVRSALGLDAKASRTETLAATKKRVDEMKAAGSSIFVVVAPEPKLVVKLDAKEKDGGKLVVVLENSLKEALARSSQVSALATEVETLLEKRASLEGEADADFADGAQRDQVKLELEAARILLQEAGLRAEAESGRALRFMVDLAGAIDTGAAEQLATAGTKQKPGGKRGAFVGKGQPGGGGGKAPPAKPKPKPAEDFDP